MNEFLLIGVTMTSAGTIGMLVSILNEEEVSMLYNWALILMGTLATIAGVTV